eukprot:scaffold1401_cov330-Pavlova_lutheri.AAC.90
MVVAPGAATFAPGGRGHRTVPTSRAFNECVQCLRTVPVDEFKTAMVHAGDVLAMKQVWSRCKQAVARGSIGCGSTIGKFVNRGPNAALNLRRCLAMSVRSAELRRVAMQGRLHKVGGKVIR